MEIFSKHLNRHNPHFIHLVQDVNIIDLYGYDVIVNTSCEHMSTEWFNKLHKGQKVFLQSTDLDSDDHINTCRNIAEMKDKYSVSNIEYAEVLNLGNYNRFMIIGTV